MTRFPAMAAINAAESRLVESRRNLHLSVGRTRFAMSAAMARPSTLALVAVASGISGFLLAPRVRTSVKSAPKGADSTIKAASRSLGRLFVSMFGAQVLSFALELGVTAWAKSGLGGVANMLASGKPDPGILLAGVDTLDDGAKAFIAGVGKHRHPVRETDPPQI